MLTKERVLVFTRICLFLTRGLFFFFQRRLYDNESIVEDSFSLVSIKWRKNVWNAQTRNRLQAIKKIRKECLQLMGFTEVPKGIEK